MLIIKLIPPNSLPIHSLFCQNRYLFVTYCNWLLDVGLFVDIFYTYKLIGQTIHVIANLAISNSRINLGGLNIGMSKHF